MVQAPVPSLVRPPVPVIAPEAVSPAGLLMVKVPEPSEMAPAPEKVLMLWLLLFMVNVELWLTRTVEGITFAAPHVVGMLSVRVPVPLLVVLDKTSDPKALTVRVPLFQV